MRPDTCVTSIETETTGVDIPGRDKTSSPRIRGLLYVDKMIIGSGIDLVEISRIQQSLDRFGERFLKRVYTTAEQAYCLRKRKAAESLAARFAAKEAAAKALGTGISHGVNWLEIEVIRESGGRPALKFSGRAAFFAERLHVVRSALSLTHSNDLAIASVVLEDGR